MPRRGNSSLYSLSPDQVRATLRACETLSETMIIKGPLYLGLRVGELAHMNANWLVGDRELMVPASMWCDCSQCADNPKHPGEWTPKYKASIRRIPITGLVKDDLLLFLTHNPKGLQMSRFTIDRQCKRIMRRAQVRFPGRGGNTSFPHALRSTCATMLAAKGANAAQLCGIMGWSNMRSAEPYIRVAAAQDGAREAMERAFG